MKIYAELFSGCKTWNDKTYIFVLIISGLLVSSLRGMTAAMDPPRVLTVQPAEFSRLTGWYPCGKRTNGRGRLGQFIVASIFVSCKGHDGDGYCGPNNGPPCSQCYDELLRRY